MNKIIIWIVCHPDVTIRFNHDTMLNALHIRVIKDGLYLEYLVDYLDYSYMQEGSEDYIILILNGLYDKLKKLEVEKND